MERLQKIIARSGLASRREAERWILNGRVTINGRTTCKLGTKADPTKDKIKVDGRLLSPEPQLRYYLFHKPPGLITSLKDPEGRPHLGTWLKSNAPRQRLFPVGRLDFHSEGLLLLTNDGDLGFRLAHPSYGLKKTYQVKVSGVPSSKDLDRLRQGIKLPEGWTSPAKLLVLKQLNRKTWLEIEIHEGWNRQLRRMLACLGYSVDRLIRTRFGPVSLGSLRKGEIRPLLKREVNSLRKAVR